MRKLITLVLTLSMLISSFGVIGVFAAGEEAAPKGTPVSTVEEFEKMNVAGDYYLTGDIDFGGKVYTGEYVLDKFNGTLDGRGHTVFNFSMDVKNGGADVGIFKYVATDTDTVIKNLNIGTENQEIVFSYQGETWAAGGLSAAQNSKSHKLEVTNVDLYINMNVESSVKVNVGGFFGATQNCIMTDCELHGSVKASTPQSWINVAGFSANPKNKVGSFVDCRNYADITAVEDCGTVRAAGFIGYTGMNVNMERCINFGNISTVKGKATCGNAHVAGLIANSFYAGSNMINCMNFGSVTSPIHAGGLVGLINKKFGTLENCVNFGKITSAVPENASALYNDEKQGFAKDSGNIARELKDYTPDANIRFVGAQNTEKVNNVFNVRFLTAVDNLEYTSVGYEIQAYAVDQGKVFEWNYTHDTKTVYEKVAGTDANGQRFEKTAQELGGKYIYALATTSVPAAVENGNVVFVITPFAKTAQGTVYGEQIACVYSSGVCMTVTHAN